MGCQATDDMSRAWPCHDAISRLVCRTSHTLTVRSRLQDASQVPLRFQHTWGGGWAWGELRVHRCEDGECQLEQQVPECMLCAEGGDGKQAC